jgi:transcriptional regulator with AAA-type ATPase domain
MYSNTMSNLDRVLEEAMNLPIEQQKMLMQILQLREIEQRRDEISQDAKLSLAEFREGEQKVQSAAEAIGELQEFI